jgi:chromate transporter
MVLLSHLYFSFGSLPQISLFFKGLSVVVAALVLHAVIEIGKSGIFDFRSVIIAVAAAIIIFMYSNIFMLLLFAISAGIVLYSKSLQIAANVPDLAVSQSDEKGFQLISVLTMFSLLGLFFYIESFHSDLFTLSWVFFRMGTLLFGGGMSMLPFIEQEVVRNYHWLTQDQFIVGIALGQATPGPILITATFVGYKVEGLRGAIATTVGMFAPSLILVTMMAEIHQKIRKNLWVKSAVKGLVASFNGLIAVFSVKLACYSLTDSISVFIALMSFFLLRSGKLATGWIILFSSAVYWLICTAFYSN